MEGGYYSLPALPVGVSCAALLGPMRAVSFSLLPASYNVIIPSTWLSLSGHHLVRQGGKAMNRSPEFSGTEAPMPSRVDLFVYAAGTTR